MMEARRLLCRGSLFTILISRHIFLSLLRDDVRDRVMKVSCSSVLV